MNPAIKIRRLEKKIWILEVLLHKISNDRDLNISHFNQNRMKKEIEKDLSKYEIKQSKTKKGIHKKSKNYIQTCPVCSREVKTHCTGNLYGHGYHHTPGGKQRGCLGSFKPGIKKEK